MRWHVNCVPLQVEPVPALCKWTRHRGFLPASTYSRGRQSWPSIMSPQTETHAFLVYPHRSSLSSSDRRKDIHPSAHMHRHWQWGGERKYLRGVVWSDHWMSWLSSCTQFNFDSKTSWAAFEKPRSFFQVLTWVFFSGFQGFAVCWTWRTIGMCMSGVAFQQSSHQIMTSSGAI